MEDRMAHEAEVKAWFDWAEQERQKHRVMTIGEYLAWRSGGDAISCPSSSDAFPGGLTLTAGPPIIGRTVARPAPEGDAP